MKRTLQIKDALPFAIIAALALLNGPALSRTLYRIVKKEIRKREKSAVQNDLQETTFRMTLTRLKNQGLVENPSRGIWRATKKAIGIHDAANEKASAYKKFIAENGKKRDTILIFDVPEKKYWIRNYLRAELVLLGYELLQKSVWIGGGPLPIEFISYLKEKELLPLVHIFSIQKSGTLPSSVNSTITIKNKYNH